MSIIDFRYIIDENLGKKMYLLPKLKPNQKTTRPRSYHTSVVLERRSETLNESKERLKKSQPIHS